jgi:hypothetical protein
MHTATCKHRAAEECTAQPLNIYLGQVNQMVRLRKDVKLARKAVDKTPGNHPDRKLCLLYLGYHLCRMYEAKDSLQYLDEAIQIAREGISLTPEDGDD